MTRVWRDKVGNPASQHSFGRKTRHLLEDAREGIVELLGAKTGGMDADQLIFTSGGTEANNLALSGYFEPDDGGWLFISPFEHPSIQVVARTLAARHIRVSVAPWNDQFWRLLTDSETYDGAMAVSFMLANNETGEVFPIQDVAGTCGTYGAFVHTDAVQAVGEIPIHFGELGV